MRSFFLTVHLSFAGISLSALPAVASECGPPPVSDSNQAICVAKQHLQMKSEVCPGSAGFSYTANRVGEYWEVQVAPNDWKSRPSCTGDEMRLQVDSGKLIKWERKWLKSEASKI